MLKSLKIEKLFNIYDYEISLHSQLPGFPQDIRFITGPNGMGKSTILRLINSLYKENYIYFLTVPFSSLVFDFDTCIITFRQSTERPEEEVDSDLPLKHIVTRVKCEFNTKGSKPVMEHAEWVLKNGYKGTVIEDLKNMKMFFESERCLYVSDNRLHTEIDADDSIIDSRVIQKVLVSIQSKLSANFKPSTHLESAASSADRQKKVLKTLSMLDKYEVELPVSIGSYLKGETMDEHILLCCENAISAAEYEIYQISAFVQILEGLMLLNKEFRLSPRYGLRFLAANENRTRIEFSRLSSGEQHVISQFYTLLFSPMHYSLVLIDEPELSFHLMWQMQYLQTIINIQNIRHASFLVATHSTHVFEGKFDLTTDLYSQFKPKQR